MMEEVKHEGEREQVAQVVNPWPGVSALPSDITVELHNGPHLEAKKYTNINASKALKN